MVYGALVAVPTNFHGPSPTCAASVTVARGSPVTWAVTAARVGTTAAVPLPAPGPTDGAEGPGPCGAETLIVTVGAAAGSASGVSARSTRVDSAGTVTVSLPFWAASTAFPP